MPATFVWARGQRARPIEVTVRVPEGSGWKVATQLVPTDDPDTFTAPGPGLLHGQPHRGRRLLGDVRGQVQGPDGPETMRIALHHQGTAAQAEAFAEGAKKIVQAEKRVWGEFPRLRPWHLHLPRLLPALGGRRRDGAPELHQPHRAPGPWSASPSARWGTVAHEYFHSWNMERIRSAELEPFDFEHADMSRELWFGEGFTSYYTDLVLGRAGLTDDGGLRPARGRRRSTRW